MGVIKSAGLSTLHAPHAIACSELSNDIMHDGYGATGIPGSCFHSRGEEEVISQWCLTFAVPVPILAVAA
eukprot:scaffold276811_cov75-Attheya_sp.AAC.1